MTHFRNSTIAALCCGGLFCSTVLASTVPDALQGVWRAPGYGFVMALGADDIRVYGESSVGCFFDKNVTEDLQQDLQNAIAHVQQVTTDRIRMGSSATTSLYTLDRLPAVPESCQQGIADTTTNTLDYLVSVMTTHYAFFEERGIDWQARVEKARGQISNNTRNRALRHIFAEMLEGFNDSHLSLTGRKGWFGSFELPAPSSRTLVPLLKDTLPPDADADDLSKALRTWYGEQISSTNEQVFDGQGIRRSGLPLMWGKRGNIGVVVQIGMQGFSESGSEKEDIAVAEQLFDEILNDFADVDAVVFDVSLNFGGHGEVARVIASRFAQEKRFAYSRFVPAEGPDSLQKVYVEPSSRTRFDGPVYLLTSDMTISAGEEFTMLMRVLDNVHHYGTATNGSLSDLLPKTLPNGWVLTLSNQIYTAPDGVCWEAKGVPPEHPMALYRADNLETARFDAVRALISIAANGQASQ